MDGTGKRRLAKPREPETPQSRLSETEIQSQILHYLKAIPDLLVWRVSNQGVKHGAVYKKSAIKGFPDIAGVTKEGRFFAIEVKVEKGVFSSEQIDWLTKLEKQKALVAVVTSLAGLIRKLEEWKILRPYY